MRVLRAGSIALDAELLRLRLHARRTVVRAVLGSVALTFFVGALGLAHVAVWSWLRTRYDWPVDSTAALLTVGDVILAGALAIVALRLGPGPLETEARLVRQQACQAIAETAVWSTLAVRLLGMLRRR